MLPAQQRAPKRWLVDIVDQYFQGTDWTRRSVVSVTVRRAFSDDLLVTLPGRLAENSSKWRLTIPLEPFSADDEFDPSTWRTGTGGPQIIESAIVAEGITLAGSELVDLAGTSFSFPVNPVEGYIDASIYLCASHNPVDITTIEFGSLADGRISARITCRFEFEHELDSLLSRSAVLDVVLGL